MQSLIMFVGDFIFKGNVGRWDLATGYLPDLIDSIEKIKKYDKDIFLYPGHGSETKLSNEIKNNEFFRG